MEKVMNFRDLGGIPTKDGKKIKKGLFFRSAMLNNATEKDIEFLKSLNLYQIFDYREDAETLLLKSDPYKKIGTIHSHYPADIKNKKLYGLKHTSNFSRIFQKVSLEDVKITYAYLPFDNNGYKAMVEALKNDEVPFQQHCTAGKDRAGLGCALLLGILGAGYDEILTDYMKSIEAKEYIKNMIGEHIPKIARKTMLKKFEPLFIVDKSLLDAAINAIKEKYETFENYLFCEYNLNQEEINEIRARYTE